MNESPAKTPSPILHRAAWIVPVSSPPVPDGAVLVHCGRILAAGPFERTRNACPAGTRLEDHGDAALVPALVNAHTHLELSAFKGAIPFPREGFPDWLGAFLALRSNTPPEAIAEGLIQGERESLDSGTALCGDIANTVAATSAAESAQPEKQVFFELLGFHCKSIAEAVPDGLESLADSPRLAMVPHSAYSVSPEVIREAKAGTRARGLPFSIHTAEHREEVEFLEKGTGFCRDLLEKLGRWNPAWTAPGTTPVRYLDTLGVLDRNTILVHAVHMTEPDWETTAKRGCTICFCPRSNRNLNAGRPDLGKALSLGIPAALGTDSLASNTDLDLFREAAFVTENYPAIRPESILRMITRNPASALGRAGDFGSIEPGGKAAILAVNIEPGLNASGLVEALLHFGSKGNWKWVNPAQN